jgi:alkylhydroperoxidase family enzyme
MAWIRVVEEAEAQGDVEEHYDALRGVWGFVPNIRKVHSLKPGLMKALHAFSQAVMRGGSSLGREREEMVAVVVSSLLKCKY